MDAAILKTQRWQRERERKLLVPPPTEVELLQLVDFEAGCEKDHEWGNDDRPETDENDGNDDPKSDDDFGSRNDDTLREYPPVPPLRQPQGTSDAQAMAQARLRALLDAREAADAAEDDCDDEEYSLQEVGISGSSSSSSRLSPRGLAASEVDRLIKETEAAQRSANAAFLHLQSSPNVGIDNDGVCGSSTLAESGGSGGSAAVLTDLQKLQLQLMREMEEMDSHSHGQRQGHGEAYGQCGGQGQTAQQQLKQFSSDLDYIDSLINSQKQEVNRDGRGNEKASSDSSSRSSSSSQKQDQYQS